MAVKELERIRTGAPQPRQKPAAPQRWKVVMHYGAPDVLPCAACLLKDVFNMNSVKALRAVKNALANGREIVYSSTREVSEEKAAEAEEFRHGRAYFCSPGMGKLSFTAEPE